MFKIFYPSQMVCLMDIELDSSSHLLNLRRQLNHNHLVSYKSFNKTCF